jgi:hypothetical protein
MEDKKYLALASIVTSALSIDWNVETYENKQSVMLRLSEAWVRAEQITSTKGRIHIIEALDILLAEKDYSFNVEVIVACSLSAAADAVVSEKEGGMLKSLCRILEVDFNVVMTRIKEVISNATSNG